MQALRLGIRGVGVVAALALSLAAAAADRPPETGEPRAEDQRRPAPQDFPTALKQALEHSPTSSNEWAPDGPMPLGVGGDCRHPPTRLDQILA